MQPHLCWVADVVGYIPVDLWAPGANINAITYPVGMLKKKIHPPPCNVCDERSVHVFLWMSSPWTVFRLRGWRGQTSWMDGSIHHVHKVTLYPSTPWLNTKQWAFYRWRTRKRDAQLEKKQNRLIQNPYRSGVQTSCISSNKSGQEFVLSHIHSVKIPKVKRMDCINTSEVKQGSVPLWNLE